jgi:hypothetical protein
VPSTLSQLRVQITGFHEAHEVLDIGVDGAPSSTRHKGTAAWFAGIDDAGRVVLGVEESLLEDAVRVVGAMCHEIAHAYRHVHRLETSPQPTEEMRTDLTTVFLGFGVLTTNSAYQYRVDTIDEGPQSKIRWQHSSTGYLPDEEMAFLLGAQLALRNDTAEQREVLRHVSANQLAVVKDVLRLYERDRQALLDALGLHETDVDAYRSLQKRRMSFWDRIVGLFRKRSDDELESMAEAQAAIRRALGNDEPPAA